MPREPSPAVALLPRIIEMRGRGMSHSEIGRELGLSWYQVRDAIKRHAPALKGEHRGALAKDPSKGTIGEQAYCLRLATAWPWDWIAIELYPDLGSRRVNMRESAKRAARLNGWPWPPSQKIRDQKRRNRARAVREDAI